MGPLYKAALLRIFAFMLLTSLSPLLFVHVEYTDKDNKEGKFQLLLSLYKSMALKYNMTITEFNNFSNVAYEALSEPKPRWTYVEGLDFVFQTLTTIGKGKIQNIFTKCLLLFHVNFIFFKCKGHQSCCCCCCCCC